MWHLFCIPFPIAHQLPSYVIQSSEFDISLYLMVRAPQSNTEFCVTCKAWIKNRLTLWWISLNKVLYLSYNITFAFVNVGFDGAHSTIKVLNYSVSERVHWNCWIYWAIFLWLKYVYFYQVNVANKAHDTESYDDDESGKIRFSIETKKKERRKEEEKKRQTNGHKENAKRKRRRQRRNKIREEDRKKNDEKYFSKREYRVTCLSGYWWELGTTHMCTENQWNEFVSLSEYNIIFVQCNIVR